MMTMPIDGDHNKREIPVLAQPVQKSGSAAPDRAAQARRAREARELGKQLRLGKMKSFQPVVGKI